MDCLTTGFIIYVSKIYDVDGFRDKKMKVGYARVSTFEQDLDLQLDALEKEGCDHIFCHHDQRGHLRIQKAHICAEIRNRMSFWDFSRTL